MTDLAGAQLEDLVRHSDGAIEVIRQKESSTGTIFEVSIDTHGITSRSGLRVRDRERFEFVVRESFPFAPPTVRVPHTRWAGTPHVQWGSQLCIYAAPSVEWNPADGMRGLIVRLMHWLERAADGTLDPDGHPLHPPVAYSDYDNGWIVIRPNLGDRVPWASQAETRQAATLFAWCARLGERVDVLEWLTFDEVREKVLSEDLVAQHTSGMPFFVMPVVLVSNELGFEYPSTAAVLARHLEASGVSEDDLLWSITTAALLTSYVETRSGWQDADAPVALILGTPSRRLEGTERLAHLVAWRFDDLGTDISRLLGELEIDSLEPLKGRVAELAGKWIDLAKATWMVTFEDRPEVTRRRDVNTASSWLRGKRVLIFGCGALGAPIAEHCVRAGVSALTVVDDSAVSPGVLVRQPYIDADIGIAKSTALARRLSRIRSDLSVHHAVGDVVKKYLTKSSSPPDFDLVVDATADVGVRAALEYVRARRREQWPPVVSVLLGHDANRGLVTVSARSATGAAHDILRRTAITARGSEVAEWSNIADDFFPDPARTEMFFPEPGCSEPTFIGSSVQVVALASMLFVDALSVLSGNENTGQQHPMTATAVRLPGTAATSNAVERLSWPNDHVAVDVDSTTEVRISQRALSEMRAEVRRGNRLRGARIETGGMLLGSFDDATRCLFIDLATGPPPDSRLSALYFQHGTEGSQEIIDHYRTKNANRMGFVGMWHTHPFGPAYPSATDQAGMGSIVALDGAGRRALMLILGGSQEARWISWRDGGTPPDIYAKVVSRGPTAHQRIVQPEPPASQYFPGGFTSRSHTPAPTTVSLLQRMLDLFR